MPGLLSFITFFTASLAPILVPDTLRPGTFQERISPSRLDSLRASTHPSTSRTHQPLTLLAVLSPECPLSRNQVFTLNRLLADDSGLAVVGLVPRLGSNDTDLSILENFRTETGARFPVVGDHDLNWMHRLGAIVTPEIFLIDSAGTIVYSGAVDDWMVTLGRKRPAPTQHYVRDAIIAVRANQQVAVPRVPAVGCRIE